VSHGTGRPLATYANDKPESLFGSCRRRLTIVLTPDSWSAMRYASEDVLEAVTILTAQRNRNV